MLQLLDFHPFPYHVHFYAHSTTPTSFPDSPHPIPIPLATKPIPPASCRLHNSGSSPPCRPAVHHDEVDIIYKVLKQAGDLGGRRSAYGSLERELAVERGAGGGSSSSVSVGGSLLSLHRQQHHLQLQQHPQHHQLPPPFSTSNTSHMPHHLQHRFHRTPSTSLSVNQGPPSSSSGTNSHACI